MATYTFTIAQDTILDYNLHDTGITIPSNEFVYSIHHPNEWTYTTVKRSFPNGWRLNLYLCDSSDRSRVSLYNTGSNTGASAGSINREGNIYSSYDLTGKKLYYHTVLVDNYSSGGSECTTNDATTEVRYADMVFTITTKESLSVVINSVVGGTASANKTSNLEQGDIVTLTATPNTGYSFSNWLSSPTVSIVNNQFTMPSSDVTITPVFEKVNNLSITNTQGGTVTANKINPIASGTLVTLTVTPSSGYELLYISSYPEVAIINSQFVMPSSDVLLTPVFKMSSSGLHAGHYNGSSYDAVVPMYYNGSSWIECEWKRYNGSSWDNADTT